MDKLTTEQKIIRAAINFYQKDMQLQKQER